MEQDNNNDRLDRFLHKAFDDFSANPSDELWHKINNNLVQPAPTPQGIHLLRPWHIAAAVLLVAGLLVAQHLYFATRLEALRQEVKQTNSNLLNEPGAPATNRPTPNTPFEPQNPGIQYNSQQLIESNTTPSLPGVIPDLPAHTNNRTALPYQPSFQPKSEINQAPPMAVNAAERIQPSIVTPQPALLGAETVPGVPPSVIAVLPALHLPSQIDPAQQLPKITFIGQPYITKVNKNNSTAVNIHFMPGTIRTSINAHHEPGPGPDPDKFFSEEHPSGAMMVAGIGIEKQINQHWSLLSGLDGIQQKFRQTLPSPLKFKDRRHGGGGNPHDDDHDFDYYIGTSAGAYLVEVELRAKDSTQSIPDDENIDLELSTSYTSYQLSLPFAAKYRHSWKKWTFFASAGARLNYLVNSKESIDNFTCNNNLFEFKEKPDLKRQTNTIKKTTADLIVSGGIEYRLRNIGIFVSPTFSKPFINPIKDDRITVSTSSFGLNAGLQYYF